MKKVAKKVEEFSRCFKEATKIWRFYYGLPENLDDIRNDSLYAIQFFATMAHEREGKNPEFPKYHIIAIKKALKGREFDEAVKDDKFPEDVWKEFVKLTNGRPNEKLTGGVVRDILKNLRDEPNIIKLIESKKIDKARGFLKSIRGIGDKLSAFIMRELYDSFGYWKKDVDKDPNKFYHLQPVDRWVRRLSKLIWETTLSKNHDTASKEIVKLCLNEDVNPVKFNQGAWFISSHFSHLCSFYRIPIEKRIFEENLGELLKQTNPKDIQECIRRFCESLRDQRIFPIILS